MEKIRPSLQKLYLGLNQTVNSLYDSISSMAGDSVSTYSNIRILKSDYQKSCSDPTFLNTLILSFRPHTEKAKKKDKEYFVQFIIDQVKSRIKEEEVKDIRKFVNGLSAKNINILWTFVDNFVLIEKRFTEICADDEWLRKECEKICKVEEKSAKKE